MRCFKIWWDRYKIRNWKKKKPLKHLTKPRLRFSISTTGLNGKKSVHLCGYSIVGIYTSKLWIYIEQITLCDRHEISSWDKVWIRISEPSLLPVKRITIRVRSLTDWCVMHAKLPCHRHHLTACLICNFHLWFKPWSYMCSFALFSCITKIKLSQNITNNESYNPQYKKVWYVERKIV